jgi:F420-dependent oxidoreductase-like protein
VDAPGASPIRLPDPCVVILVGASGSGKSHWAAAHFEPGLVVSSDRLRALVGAGEHDQAAGTDAFAVLDLVLERRSRRRLTTVVDTLGLDAKKRRRWLKLAHDHGLPCYAVWFSTDARLCRSRNAARVRPVPARVLAGQLQQIGGIAEVLSAEGFDAVHPAAPSRLVPDEFVTAPEAAARQKETPMPLPFELQIPNFTWPGGAAELGPRLRAAAVAAEDAGFAGLWVMDHFVQIPGAGRAWDEMLDSYTTLGFLASATSTARLGALVTGVTYRNLPHLAKIVATLDVLSGGRAVCGVGAAWYEREHRAYGWRFPPLRDRYALLEDALRLLPVMWGKGTPSFEGATITVPEAICYPRPLQDPVPILVGGSGERRTLRLVAEYADACNLFGGAATVRHKVDVLRRHCHDVGRDPSDVEVTHLSTVMVSGREGERRSAPDGWRLQVHEGSVDDHVGRFRELAEAGVQTAIVSLADLADGPAAVERFAPVIAAVR